MRWGWTNDVTSVAANANTIMEIYAGVGSGYCTIPAGNYDDKLVGNVTVTRNSATQLTYDFVMDSPNKTDDIQIWLGDSELEVDTVANTSINSPGQLLCKYMAPMPQATVSVTCTSTQGNADYTAIHLESCTLMV